MSNRRPPRARGFRRPSRVPVILRFERPAAPRVAAAGRGAIRSISPTELADAHDPSHVLARRARGPGGPDQRADAPPAALGLKPAFGREVARTDAGPRSSPSDLARECFASVRSTAEASCRRSSRLRAAQPRNPPGPVGWPTRFPLAGARRRPPASRMDLDHEGALVVADLGRDRPASRRASPGPPDAPRIIVAAGPAASGAFVWARPRRYPSADAP
jgi:hypothetical protein